MPQPGGPVHELGRRAELGLPGVVHRRGEVEQGGLHVVLLRLGLGASPLAKTDLGQEKLGEAGAGMGAGEGALDGAGEEAREGAGEGAGVGAEGAEAKNIGRWSTSLPVSSLLQSSILRIQPGLVPW